MNDPSKLFRVLVMGGAMLGTACVSAPAEVGSDGSTPDAAADNGEDAGAVEDELCFCPGPESTCCEAGPGGASVPREGIMCCWGTSC